MLTQKMQPVTKLQPTTPSEGTKTETVPNLFDNVPNKERGEWQCQECGAIHPRVRKVCNNCVKIKTGLSLIKNSLPSSTKAQATKNESQNYFPKSPAAKKAEPASQKKFPESPAAKKAEPA